MAIAFMNLENHPDLSYDEEFSKGKSIIGEFLKPSSTDPPPTIEIEGLISSIFLEGSSQPASKPSSLPTHPTKPPNPQLATATQTLNIHVKRKSKKNSAPLPAKIILGGPKSKDPQARGSGGKGCEQEPL